MEPPNHSLPTSARSLGALIRSDIVAASPNAAHLSGLRFWMRALGKALISANVRVVIIYRLSHVLSRRGLHALALVLRSRGIRTSGAEINPHAEIGPGLYLAHSVGVGVGPNVRIGTNCRLHLGSVIGPQPHGKQAAQYTVIGDDVYIGTHAVVMGGVTIGNGASIGANAVVMRDVAAYAIVAGSPGRIVGQREPDDPRP